MASLALVLLSAQPALAQFQCQSGHYDVVVPGYVYVPASVDVDCGGLITTMDIQWPFDDPSPEAWHNRYEFNSADLSCSITVGEVWLCTLQWIENEGGATRFVITGCPAMYGGTGRPVPWNDPCIQKVRNRIYPDFWIFKNVVARNGSPSLAKMCRLLTGFGLDIPPTEPTDQVPRPPSIPNSFDPAKPQSRPELDSHLDRDQTKLQTFLSPCGRWPTPRLNPALL